MIPELETTIDGMPCSFLSGRTDWIEVHHVYPGALRRLSERYGLCVYLNHYEHNEPPDGVHFNRSAMDSLQAKVQKIAMEHYGWSVEDWISIFGRNFL